MIPLISAEEEPSVRLLAFGLGLLAIATRESVGYPVSGLFRDEAHAIADAFVEEAKRLDAQRQPPP